MKLLYVRLLKEELRDNAIWVIPDDRCAVFDEKEFDGLIQETTEKLWELKRLRSIAVTHSHSFREDYLKTLGVPFKIRRFRQKKC